MRNFSYAIAASADTAVAAGAGGAAYLAGGTELLNWMRLGISAPERVLDISRIAGLERIEVLPGLLRIGAMARLADVAADPAVLRNCPALAHAIGQAASAQLRNLATLGGNILQRTRCAYFRAEVDLPCNKRRPGTGCPALLGESRSMAIFSWDQACAATQPSDPAVALACLEAVVHVLGVRGPRAIAMVDFHRQADGAPDIDNVLEAGDLITHFDIPIQPASRRSTYIKIRERASYEFALVSAAAAIELDRDKVIISARIALGSVACKPWRLPLAEAALAGQRFDEALIRQIVATAGDFATARPLPHNGFKIELAQRVAARALLQAGANGGENP